MNSNLFFFLLNIEKVKLLQGLIQYFIVISVWFRFTRVEHGGSVFIKLYYMLLKIILHIILLRLYHMLQKTILHISSIPLYNTYNITTNQSSSWPVSASSVTKTCPDLSLWSKPLSSCEYRQSAEG